MIAVFALISTRVPMLQSRLLQALEGRREAFGMDQQAFAAYLTAHGVTTSASTYSRFVNGLRVPRHDWLRGVCRLWPDLAALVAADLLAPDGLPATSISEAQEEGGNER